MAMGARHLDPSVRAALASTALFLVAAVAAYQLTHGFAHWTFESARRSDAAQQRLLASSLVVRTSQAERLVLWLPVLSSTTKAPHAKAYLVDFIYTTCPGVCQVLGSEFAQMQRQLSDAEPASSAVMLLSLSFDLQRDGTAELAQYAQRYGADGLRWQVAAPLSEADNLRLLRELSVISVPDGQGGYVHNGAIHLLDGSGRVLAIFDTAQWREALAAASAWVQPQR